jgi:hypothetical protein
LYRKSLTYEGDASDAFFTFTDPQKVYNRPWDIEKIQVNVIIYIRKTEKIKAVSSGK